MSGEALLWQSHMVPVGQDDDPHYQLNAQVDDKYAASISTQKNRDYFYSDLEI